MVIDQFCVCVFIKSYSENKLYSMSLLSPPIVKPACPVPTLNQLFKHTQSYNILSIKLFISPTTWMVIPRAFIIVDHCYNNSLANNNKITKTIAREHCTCKYANVFPVSYQ